MGQSARSQMNRADSLFIYNPGQALQLLESALSTAIQSENVNLESDCYVVIAKVNNHLGQHDIAVRNLRRAQSVRTRPVQISRSNSVQTESMVSNVQDDDGVSYDYNTSGNTTSSAKYSSYRIQKMLGTSLRRQGLLTEAITELELYSQLASSRNDTLELISTWNLIGDIYLNLNQPNQAQTYYERGASYTGTELMSEVVKSNVGIGNAEVRRGNYDRAVSQYVIAEESLNQIENRTDTLPTQLSTRIAEGYNQVGRTDREIALRSRNVADLSERAESPSRLIDEEVSLANSYLTEGNTSSAFSLLNQAKNRAEASGDLSRLASAWKGLSKYYEAEGDVSNALDAYRNFVEITDSVEAAERNRLSAQLAGANTVNQQLLRLESLESEMRVSEQRMLLLQQDKELQSSALRQRNSIIIFLSVGLLLVLVAITWIIVVSRKRNRANQMLALKSLRAQMNPHFIFNALNSINGFISRKQEREANKYLAEFSKLMRSVLEDSQEEFLSLRDELENLERYTKLEHSRFDDKFSYEIQVDDAIDKDQWSIPPMLLQPYVENAVWHGLRYLESPGLLSIRVAEEGSILTVTIEDNGVGRTKSQTLKTKNQKKNKSTGIKNTAERLKLLNELYKTQYHIEVSDLHPEKENTGTRVVVRMPNQPNHE